MEGFCEQDFEDQNTYGVYQHEISNPIDFYSNNASISCQAPTSSHFQQAVEPYGHKSFGSSSNISAPTITSTSGPTVFFAAQLSQIAQLIQAQNSKMRGCK